MDVAASVIAHYAELYSRSKSALGSALGLSDDLLHVHVGLALFLLAALFTRQPIRSWLPLSVVIMFAVANEIIDFFGPDPWNDGLSALDLANTLVWPLMLFLLARIRKVQ